MTFTQEELIDGINQLLTDGKHSVQNCEKLAAIYTVLDHLYPHEEALNNVQAGYSADTSDSDVGRYGDSDFLLLIADKRPEQVWTLIDELMSTVKVLYPKLYDNVIERLVSL